MNGDDVTLFKRLWLVYPVPTSDSNLTEVKGFFRVLVYYLLSQSKLSLTRPYVTVRRPTDSESV